MPFLQSCTATKHTTMAIACVQSCVNSFRDKCLTCRFRLRSALELVKEIHNHFRKWHGVLHVNALWRQVFKFDQLKSRSQGYASLDYELAGYRASDLVRVDILLNALPADAFSTIVHRDKAYDYGNRMCAKLRELIPRQMFDVPIQAAIGGRIIARETVKAKRKDVLAKCYGGDISRKRKLLEKQKEGKKKMKSIGRVEVPGDVFISALKLDD